jgi:hypothetical protein
MDKAKEWQMELLMEKLRSKAGQFKSFVESAKALRMSLLASICSYLHYLKIRLSMILGSICCYLIKYVVQIRVMF